MSRSALSTRSRAPDRPVGTTGHLVEALLFDLDGTLVHSLPDIADAINVALRAEGAPPLTLEEVKARLGQGAAAILAPALDETDPCAARVERAVSIFISHYRANLARRTRPRRGVPEVLAHFHAVPKFVVSNKPEALARGVLDALSLAGHFEGIYGGDSFARKKPDPAPIVQLLDRYRLPRARAVMVGDSPVDVQAGKAAGVMTCAVLGGYSSAGALSGEHPDVLLGDMGGLLRVFRPVP